MKQVILWFYGLLLLGGSLSFAQTTALTATVVDSDGVTWANGTWAIQFLPNPSNPTLGAYNINGVPLSPSVMTQSGALSSGGALAATIYNNSSIAPGGSSWAITICPNAASQCGTYNFQTTTSSLDISAALTSTIPAPRFKAVINSYGYADVEAQIQIAPGSTYYNVANSCYRIYSGSSWGCITSASPPPGWTITGSGSSQVATAPGTIVAGATNPVTIGGATSSCTGLFAKADGSGCALGLPGQAGTVPFSPTTGQIQTSGYAAAYHEGDSITAGSYATPTSNGYAYLLDTFAGTSATYLNSAVAGSEACDDTWRIFNYWPNAQLSTLYTVADGTNDANHSGAGLYEQNYGNCLTAAAVYATAAFASTGGSGCTLDSNWTSDTYYAQVTGAKATANGARAWCPYTTTIANQAVYVTYRMWDGNSGQVAVVDNGGATASAYNNYGAIPQFGVGNHQDNINTQNGNYQGVGTLALPSTTRGLSSAIVGLSGPPTTNTLTTATTGGTLTDATTYYYRVSALNAIGETLASTEVSKVTGTGGNLNTVTIPWNAVTNATGYKVYCRTTGAEALCYTANASTLTWTDTGSVTPNTSNPLPFVNTSSSYGVMLTVTSTNPALGGSGWSGTPVLEWSGACGGSGLTATLSQTAGVLQAPTLTNGGSGWTCAPFVNAAQVGGGGIGAPITATIAGGTIASISVLNGGNYTTTPTITAAPQCYVSGTETFTPVMSGSSPNAITSVTFSGGALYNCSPHLIVTGGFPTVAATLTDVIQGSVVTALTLAPSAAVAEVLGVQVAPATIGSTTPGVWIEGVLRQEYDALSATTASYNDDAQYIATTLNAQGLPVYFVNSRSWVQGTALDMTNGLHPNNVGYANLARGFESPTGYLQSPQFKPKAQVSNALNDLGPTQYISSSTTLGCNQFHVAVTATATINMPPAGSCLPSPGYSQEDSQYIITVTAPGAVVTLSTSFGNSTTTGNVNGLTMTQGQSIHLVSYGNTWWYVAPPLTSPTVNGTALFNNNTPISMTNGADHGIGVTCKPGLTGEYGCADNYYTYAGTQIWSVGPVPATNGQTSGTVNWSILDSANSNFVRFNLVNGGAADINAYGSNAFSVNRYTNAGTLGFRVYSGGATPTQVGAIDSSGNLTLSGSVKVATGRKGTFVCTAAGTITITNANETVTSDVVISLNTTGGTITTPPAMKTVTAGASFTVLCGASDTSTYNYDILN